MTDSLAQRIYGRYFQVALADLNQGEECAIEVANVISSNHSRLASFAIFCLYPNARSLEVNHAILSRFLTVAPSYLVLSDIYKSSRIRPEKYKKFNEQTVKSLSDVSSEIATNHFKMDTALSAELTNCISMSAAPTFAFYQRSNLPNDYSLRKHTSLLRTFIHEAVPFLVAASVLISTHSSQQCS